MNKPVWVTLWTVVITIAWQNASLAQAQLSGTPEELREFLYPRPHTVNITGEGQLHAYKDVATVSLLITTEDRELSVAMSQNQSLRDTLIDGFTAAGIPGAAINNARFSSAPQLGLLGRNPNAYEVSARLEVKARSEEHLQLLAAAADEHEEVIFDGTEFEHSDEEEFERQVHELAIEDVMAQKAYYETSLGIELRAINFFYGNLQRQPRDMPLRAMEFAADSAGMAGTAAANAAITPSFDEVDYRMSVTVIFEIVESN